MKYSHILCKHNIYDVRLSTTTNLYCLVYTYHFLLSFLWWGQYQQLQHYFDKLFQKYRTGLYIKRTHVKGAFMYRNIIDGLLHHNLVIQGSNKRCLGSVVYASHVILLFTTGKNNHTGCPRMICFIFQKNMKTISQYCT